MAVNTVASTASPHTTPNSDHAQPGDVIILAGKGHETYQIIGHEKRHLDEREVVADYVRELQQKERA